MSATTNFNYVIYKHYSDQYNAIQNKHNMKNTNQQMTIIGEPKQEPGKLKKPENERITIPAMPCILL